MTVEELSTLELARHCREQTLRFLRGEHRDDSFCFEIFQRAVVQRDDSAWEAIVGQYRGIVLAYVTQHTAATMLHESDEFWVTRAFQRFWGAVSPDRFAQFPDLAALLKYLKMCVHSVLMDEVRSRRSASLIPLDQVPESLPSGANAEGKIVGKLAGEQLWEVICRELNDEAEQQVVYLSFARDLKPADIAIRRPDLFSSVADVYRIKRNIIDRLRRSPEIRAFLGT